MKINKRRIFAFLMVLVLLFSNTNVAFAAPGDRPGGSGEDVYDHIDVRQEGSGFSMTYITKNFLTGEVVSTRTVEVDCTVTAIKSVSYTELAGTEDAQSWTWTSGFTNDGSGYEFRLMNQSFSTDLSGSYATIVVDLTNNDTGEVYEDVTFSFGPDGCQQAVYDCDGYSQGSGGGRGSVGLDFILGVNESVTVTYIDLVIPATKVWNDDNDRDGIRPESVQVQLYANGVAVPGAIVTLSEENGWTAVFPDQEAVDADGNGIEYTIQEVTVPDGYTATVDQSTFTVTNSYTPQTTSVSGGKTWVDNDNQDGMRPESITVELYANGQPTGLTKTVTAEDGWAWTFDNIPLNDGGVPIEYTVVEADVDGYTPTYDGMNVTNTHEIIKTEVTVTKLWDDNDDQDGKRPDSITVDLYANGEKVASATVTAEEGWTYTFTDLDAYANGEEIVYTVVEQAVEGYESSVDGWEITNTHIPEKISISGSKTWNDNNDQDGVRPDAITVRLYADGEEVASQTVTAEEGWTWTFADLDKYANGVEIVYTVTEDAVSGYTAAVDGYNITNTHTTAKTEVEVTKLWDDADNQDGKRPESVTVKLLANGEDTGKTLTLTAATNWTGKFENLEKYYDGGKEIQYTVVEADVPAGYTATYSEDGLTVTNTHVPETVSISGGKTWNDAGNQDGKRPASITIHLLANGVEVASQTVTADSGWTWSFTGLPKYENGVLITYTISEDAVAGYTPSYDGYNVTNTHSPEKTYVEVNKVWDDADNQDGKRPNDITVILLADGEKVAEQVLSEANGWKAVFSDLDVYKDGKKIVYTIQEIAVPEYTTEIDGYTITNTHVPETVEVSGSKTWDDADNQDGKRPESITINLLADGVKIDSVTVTAADGWAWSFENLPKYTAGKEITYTVTEDAVENYATTIDGYNVTNSYTPEQTSITVSKYWADAGNQDGIRPNDVTVILLADGVEVGRLTLNSGNGWTGTFTNLDVYKAGQKIVYTIEEISVPGYTTTITGDQTSGYTITNSHTPEVTEISGSKTWDDHDNQDGKRPESITIRLYADGVEIDSITVTEADGWAWSFTGLPMHKAEGIDIVYTISEDAVEEYTSVVSGYNVVNTHAPEKTSVSVTKAWADSNDQDGIRPEYITVVLVANGEPTEYTLTLTESNNWSGTFTDLDKYLEGQEIAYTVQEIEVAGYNTVITGNAGDGYIISNSHTPEVTSVSGSKTWVDADDQDGFRPASITIRLLADGKEIDSVTVTEADGWAWSFENLPKYRDGGVEIVYSVTEDAVEDYSSSVNGYNVTNEHTPEQTSVAVSKSWQDNDDQDGIRPEEITVVLLADGVETEYTLVLNEGNSWTGSFTGLDKYADGVEIKYTVAELEVKGYNTVITGNMTEGFHITNSHTPEVTAVSGSKTWDDNNNQDGFRPASITINLMADGVKIDSVTVTEADGWAWSFENLPKYKDHGTQIVYSIVEEGVPEYSTGYNGYNVVNTHTPEQTSVTVTKAWADRDNQDGIRPNDVTVILLANGEETEYTLVLNEGNYWTGSFTGLDKYADGVEIVYTVIEEEVTGYTAVITGDQASGYTITNCHTPETIEISGSKIWDDNNNQDGFRPEEITINLLADGEIVDTVTVTEADGWAWTFTELPKYRDGGVEIIYSITENAVEDYSAEYDGFNVINTHTPEQTSLTVSKSWQDNDDQDGIRPGEIIVILLADGEPTGDKLVLDEESNWTGSFTELDKYADGVEIEYTVEEITVEGYSTVITGDMTTGYTITNSHTPEVTAISGSKTWDDKDNQDGVRPESITVNLMANGQIVKTLTVTEAENWSWSFENLPKYENGGVEIIYAITEEAVEGYTTTYDGYDIINSYTPAETSVTVTKAWADSNNEDGLRPGKVTITLYANGQLIGKTLVLTAEDNWSGSFVGLPKYAGGVEIVYTIGEVEVDGYNTVIRGDMVSGFVVTNSHTVIPQTGDERTPMLWALLMLASAAVVAYVGYDTKKRKMING